ncbi:MAG: hypothetical protein U0992_08435 [Planctomycetaceae bacterium]
MRWTINIPDGWSIVLWMLLNSAEVSLEPLGRGELVTCRQI